MMSKCNVKEITIDGTTYVPKSDIEKPAGAYVIVRTYSAGVHAGYLESRNGKEVVLRNTRRIWYWKGAASLSQAAGTGITKIDECKIPAAIDSIILTEAIEIIPCTETAKAIIEGAKPWVQ